MLVPDTREEFRVLITSRSKACLHKSIPSIITFFDQNHSGREQFSPWEQEQIPRKKEAQEHVYRESTYPFQLLPFCNELTTCGSGPFWGGWTNFSKTTLRMWPRCHSCHQHHFLFLIFRILHKIINLLELSQQCFVNVEWTELALAMVMDTLSLRCVAVLHVVPYVTELCRFRHWS